MGGFCCHEAQCRNHRDNILQARKGGCEKGRTGG